MTITGIDGLFLDSATPTTVRPSTDSDRAAQLFDQLYMRMLLSQMDLPLASSAQPASGIFKEFMISALAEQFGSGHSSDLGRLYLNGGLK